MIHLTDENDIAFYDIIGAAMEVHAEFKSGLLEAVYAEVMTIELENRGIEFESEVNLPIYYKGTLMQKKISYGYTMQRCCC